MRELCWFGERGQLLSHINGREGLLGWEGDPSTRGRFSSYKRSLSFPWGGRSIACCDKEGLTNSYDFQIFRTTTICRLSSLKRCVVSITLLSTMDFSKENTVWLFLSVWLLWPWNLSCCQLLEQAKGSKFFLYKSSLKLARLGGWTSFPELLLSKDQEENKALVEPGKTLYFVLEKYLKAVNSEVDGPLTLFSYPYFPSASVGLPSSVLCVLFFHTCSHIIITIATCPEYWENPQLQIICR